MCASATSILPRYVEPTSKAKETLEEDLSSLYPLVTLGCTGFARGVSGLLLCMRSSATGTWGYYKSHGGIIGVCFTCYHNGSSEVMKRAACSGQVAAPGLYYHMIQIPASVGHGQLTHEATGT